MIYITNTLLREFGGVMFVVTLINGQYQKQFEYTSLKPSTQSSKRKVKGQLYYPFAVVTGDGVDELYGKSSSTEVTNDTEPTHHSQYSERWPSK